MLKEYSLEGKTALITGAGRGLGKAIAIAFAEAGADIAVAARTPREIEQTAAEVRQEGRRCITVPTDVSKEDQIKNMVQKTLAEFGKIDILVNNAGIELTRPILPLPDLKMPVAMELEAKPLSLQEWQKLMDVNLNAIFLCCREVGIHMIEQRKGKIINITSGQGVKATPYMIPYSVSKAAVNFFTRCLALEWVRYNINVNALAPGVFETSLLHEITGNDEKVLARYLKDVPMRRIGDPREVALLAVYLASKASDYMTGQVIVLDGGGSAR